MAQMYETVSSNRGTIKLVISGYIMTKDKNRDNLYYWCCEKRKTLRCGGYACTILINGQHNLRNTKEHNHSPDATRKDFITAVHNLKRKTRETNNTPAQIIQVETNTVSSYILIIKGRYQQFILLIFNFIVETTFSHSKVDLFNRF